MGVGMWYSSGITTTARRSLSLLFRTFLCWIVFKYLFIISLWRYWRNWLFIMIVCWSLWRRIKREGWALVMIFWECWMELPISCVFEKESLSFGVLNTTIVLMKWDWKELRILFRDEIWKRYLKCNMLGLLMSILMKTSKNNNKIKKKLWSKGFS